MCKFKDKIAEYESRFKEVSNLNGDLTIFPLDKNNTDHHLQVITDKTKSDKHGEVFTPLWLVDEMIQQVDLKSGGKYRNTMDLCAGYGQFTIRLMRARASLGCFTNNQIDKFLSCTHSFFEFQFSSCYKLLYIFGTDINLFIGDARHITELEENDNGLMVYNEHTKKWMNVTDKIKKLFENPNHNEIEFEKLMKKTIKNKLRKTKIIQLLKR